MGGQTSAIPQSTDLRSYSLGPLTYSIRLVQIQVPLTHIDVSRLVFLLYPGLDLSCYLIRILQAVYNDFPTFASRHVYIFEMKGRADGYIQWFIVRYPYIGSAHILYTPFS